MERDAVDGRRYAGTPAYMEVPNRRVREARRVDGTRAIFYSLGVVFYELLHAENETGCEANQISDFAFEDRDPLNQRRLVKLTKRFRKNLNGSA